MTDKLKWEVGIIAEDELSELRRQRSKVETPEQFAEAARELQSDTFWPAIEALADFCDQVLLDNGYPRATQLVRHDGAGRWWDHPSDAPHRPPPGETWKFERGYKLAEDFAKGFSDPWYAGRIGFKCRLALEHSRKGDSGPFLFSMIFEIASLRTDWRWRSGYKPSILTGQKQRRTLDRQRGKAHEKQRQAVMERREAIRTLLGETSRKGGALVD